MTNNSVVSCFDNDQDDDGTGLTAEQWSALEGIEIALGLNEDLICRVAEKDSDFMWEE